MIWEAATGEGCGEREATHGTVVFTLVVGEIFCFRIAQEAA